MHQREESRRDEVLRELEIMAQGSQHDSGAGQQSAVMRFTKQPEWQHASDLIIQALQTSLQRRRSASAISAPAGWLPLTG